MNKLTKIWGLWSIPLLVAILAIWLAGGTNAVYATDGDLDPTFSGDGKVTTDIYNDHNDMARAVAIQANGEIWAAGYTAQAQQQGGLNFALTRYLPDGTLQATSYYNFNNSSDQVNDLAIQADGNIVAAGDATVDAEEGGNFGLARLLPNGQLDPSFGVEGLVDAHFGINHDHAYGVAIQADGKIVAAGDAHVEGLRYNFALARYLHDGTLDTSFSGDGKVTTDFDVSDDNDDDAYAMAIQADGKIVVAGTTRNGDVTDFALARYLSNGTLDTSFSGDGKVTTDFAGSDDLAHAMAIQADGKIIAVGLTQSGIGNDDFALTRYLPDGSLDTSFSGDGKVTTDFDARNDYAYGVAIQADGKIVVAGQMVDALEEFHFGLARYLPNGDLDASFSGDGLLNTDFDGTASIARDIAVQPDGKIVAAGGAGGDFAVARYRADLGGEPTPTAIPPTATAIPTPCVPGQFTDVPPDHTFYPYVSCLVDRGVMSGYSDCTFRPSLNLTRGQLAKVVSNAANFTEPHTSQSFEDVATDHAFYLWIERLASRGIIGGYACGGEDEPCVPPGNRPYFRTGNNVTRGQTAKIVAVAAGLPAPSQGSWTFQDVPGDHTFWQWIEALSAAGAIGGYGCGGEGEPCVPPNNRPYFRVGNNVTRGQASKVVANAFFPDCQTR